MAGRTKKYTTEILKGIIDSYYQSGRAFGQVSASQLADYAKKELGYEKIRYFNFTRDKEIKDFLNEINNKMTFDEVTDDVNGEPTLIEFNPDKLLDTYKNDDKMLRTFLRGFAERHNDNNRRLLELHYSSANLEDEVKRLRKELEKVKKEKAKLKSINEKYKAENQALQRLKTFKSQSKMRSFLNAEGLFDHFDEENLMILLEKTGLTVDDEDLIQDLEEFEVSNDIEEDNIIEFSDINKKDNDGKSLVSRAKSLL